LLRRPVKVVIVLCGKIARQLIVNGIFGEPLQGRQWGVLRRRVRASGRFDMHHERLVSRKIDGMFGHDYFAVKVGFKCDHSRRITYYDYARQSCIQLI
jgi:hypothetical protein